MHIVNDRGAGNHIDSWEGEKKKKKKHKQGQKHIHLHEESLRLLIHSTREPLDCWSSVCDERQSLSLPGSVFPIGEEKDIQLGLTTV